MAGTHIFTTSQLSLDVEKMAEIERMAHKGRDVVFQARSIVISPIILEYMERRDRAVFLLVDGKRTLQDIARLLHHPELDVAKILVHLFRRGYIEFTSTPNKT